MKRLLPVCIMVMFLPTLRSFGQVNVQDSLALVDLYNSTNGNGWTNKTNWLTTQPVAVWYGITVLGNRVYSINLMNNNLVGVIPASLGNLNFLQSLTLDVNKLTGSIPASLGNLSNLQYLSIIENQLSGVLPSSLGSLSSLIWMRFSDNHLSGPLPTTLGNLSNLVYFYMGDNQFTGTIPASLGNLTKLLFLQLYRNQLTGGIPPSLGNLPNLYDLELEYNNLTGSIPASLGSLSSLGVLVLLNNQLSGPIPASVANLNLSTLYIGYNNFTFSGMELVAQRPIGQKIYAPQANIPISDACGKLSVSVGGTPANNVYTWLNNGVLQATITGDSTFTPSGPGSYSVFVTNSIATDLTLHSDTITNNVLTKTVNAQICGDGSYTLPSGKQVSVPGTFRDTVQSVSGCGDSLITIVNLVVSNVTKITVNPTICAGEYFQLPSGTRITDPGTYIDTVHNLQGCDSQITTLNLKVNRPMQINSNAIICSGQTYALPSGRIVSGDGVYADTLRSSQYGCDSIITSLTLTVDPSTQQIEDSLAICPGSPPVVLNAGNGSNIYLWNNGASSNAIVVSIPGQYIAVVYSAGGCVAHDTFTVIARAAPVIGLDKDMVLCQGQPRLIDAGANYKSYLWNTGATSQKISITTTGIYWVTVTDKYNCSATDTTDVDRMVVPPTNFLPPDTAVCTYASVSIQPKTGFDTYEWSTGEVTAAILVSQPGIYSLRVTDSNGCVGADTIVVNPKQCIEGFFVPNGFTPNGDGHNDLLKPVSLYNFNLARYHFVIFNRWGQRVFETSNLSVGWDGKINGILQDAGVYVWALDYQYLRGPAGNEKGTVILIR